MGCKVADDLWNRLRVKYNHAIPLAKLIIGSRWLKEPPYDVTTLFTLDPRAKMAEQPINSIENIKKADYEDRLRIKKGRQA